MTWSGRSFLTSNTSKILDFKPSQLCMGQMKHNMQVTQLVIMNALSIHINDFIGSNYVGNVENHLISIYGMYSVWRLSVYTSFVYQALTLSWVKAVYKFKLGAKINMDKTWCGKIIWIKMVQNIWEITANQPEETDLCTVSAHL